MPIELPPLIAGLIGGVIGWFVTQFVAEPLRRFFGMRRDIAQRLLDYANVRAPRTEQDEARVRVAQEKLRDFATQTLSFVQTDPVATTLIQLIWRYDLQKAGQSLLLFSLDIALADEQDRETHRKNVGDALRLKPLSDKWWTDRR
jgi:hypothetical protein